MKSRMLGMAGLALMAFSGLATAGVNVSGINLSWNDCGTAGAASATFDCNSNSGLPFSMLASFTPPAGVTQFLGMTAQLDVKVGATLPDWWRHGAAECRGTTGMSTSFDFTAGPFTCADFYVGQAAGGTAWDSGFQSANRGRLRVTCAVPIDNRGPVDSATEYYAFKVNLARSKTLGGGSCAGCSQEACIVFNSIQLFQPPDQNNDPVLTTPKDRNYVTWQNSAVANCPSSTPVRNTTWGTIKGLYR